MHMPGHKRNPVFGNDIFAYDITEIEGFDNLHNPKGIMADAERKLCGLYNAKRSFIQVNGATGGILTLIMAAARPGGTLAIGSNCHISVWHAAELSGCRIRLLSTSDPEGLPFAGQVTPETVEEALAEDPSICAVIITSPTYEGIVSPTPGIYAVTDKSGIPLIIDSAHGAHLGLSPHFLPAPTCDADVVSLHKTLPSPTQTAAVNLYTDKIDTFRVMHFIDVFESSSPSYVLTDGAISCIDQLAEGIVPLDRWAELLDSVIYTPLASLKHIKLYDSPVHDKSKIVLICSGIKLAQHLRSAFNIEVEAAFSSHLIAMTGAGDTEESLTRFKEAILSSDLPEFAKPKSLEPVSDLPGKRLTVSIRDALSSDRIMIPIDRCESRISAEYVFCYPPGVPLLIPGETITPELIQKIGKAYIGGASFTLSGRRDWDGTLCCLDD